MTQSELKDLVAATEGLQPARRLLHAAVGLASAGLIWAIDFHRGLLLIVFGALSLLLFAADLVRLAVPALNVQFFRTFRLFASPREADRIASSTWYVAGILVAVALFPTEIVVPAILVLSLADPVANYVGWRWGTRRLGTGTVEGVVAFTLVGGLILPLFVPGWVALVAALVAAVAEVLPWRLDDNLVIPISVATILWVASAWPI